MTELSVALELRVTVAGEAGGIEHGGDGGDEAGVGELKRGDVDGDARDVDSGVEPELGLGAGLAAGPRRRWAG